MLGMKIPISSKERQFAACLGLNLTVFSSDCDACYDIDCTFLLKWFLYDGAAYPQIVGTWPLFSMILVVSLGNGVFIPWQFRFSLKQFWGEVLSSKIEEPQKKRGAPPS